MNKMENSEALSQELENLLIKIIILLGDIKYLELEKSFKILKQRNVKQYPSIKNKIGDVIMRIYNSRMKNEKAENEIIKNLDKIYVMIDDLIES